ncbi:AAA family ATPase [bacterium]|jgi:DNA sulfur modification protein DndD|nr:AAA family ATPase [bacterium]
MKIKRLKVYNVGPYYQEASFSFDETSIGKPLILIRGHNGAGKTHIFESIKYCLFGSRILNGTKEKNFLEDFTYKSKDNDLDSTGEGWVSLEIYDPLENSDILIKRSWTKGDKINIFLNVNIESRSENISVDYEDEDAAQSYINTLVPYNYIDLFFYDGEETKRKFKETRSKGLFDLIDSVFGIKLINQSIEDVNRLRNDLIRNAIKDSKFEESLVKLKKLEALDAKELSSIEKYENELETLMLNIEDINAKKEGVYLKFQEMGGKYIEDLNKNNGELLKINETIAEDKEQLRRLSEKTIPLLLCPGIYNKLQKEKITQEHIKKFDTLNQFFNRSEVGNIIDKGTIKKLTNILSIESIQDLEHKDDLVNEFNGYDEALKVLKCLTDNLEKSRKIKESIDNVPLDTPIEIKQIKEYESAFSDLMEKKGGITNSLTEIKTTNAKTVKEKEIFLKKIKIGKDEETKTKHEKALKILSKFKEHVYASKDSLLSQNLVDKFSVLSRKNDFITKVQIDYDKKLVTYKDKNNRRIPKFSAGENHILSVAWIWALSDMTTYDIPFVIDTPMGSGLDEVHRRNLIEIFLKNASSQTIVLSNDDEINEESAKLLSNLVSTTYRIINSGDRTTVRKIND